VLRDGTVVGPCLDVNQLGTSNKVTFNGVGPSAGSRMVNKGDTAYDGKRMDASIVIP
jgi:hypothetical protein